MKFVQAILIFALISMMMCVNIRQEQAPVQAVETAKPEVQGEEESAPVEQTKAEVAGEEEEAAHTEGEEEATPVVSQEGEEEAAPEQTQGEEEAVHTEEKTAEVQTTETKQEEGAGEATPEAKVESAAKVEAKVEAKSGATLTPWTKPGVPEDHTRIKVLTREGTTKDILVADSSKDLENSRNCQRDNLNNPVIQLCANLICDECLNSDVCGWCGESGKCMAGNPGDALCPGDCLNHWFFHDQTNCPRLINSGSFSNVAPESTKLIVPELAVPKLKVATSEIDEAKLTVQVVTGTTQTTTSSRQVDEDGIIDEVHQAQQAPMTSDLVQKAPTEHKITEVTTDLQTGERLDLPDTEIKTHGVDQVEAAAPAKK